MRTQRFIIEDSSSLEDSQLITLAHEFVVVVSYVGINRLVSHPVHRKVSRHQYAIAVTADHAHISYHPPGP